MSGYQNDPKRRCGRILAVRLGGEHHRHVDVAG
jgi:hypothetical protein